MRKLLLAIVLLSSTLSCVFAQNYNEDRTAMTNFIVRMYRNAPFEGVKVFTDYEHTYLLSVLSLDSAKYPNISAMNRVAGVKAMSQASRYFNGSEISTDLIVHSTEKADGNSDSEIIETIRERSVGYVKSLEFLTTLNDENNRIVFIFCKEINQ